MNRVRFIFGFTILSLIYSAQSYAGYTGSFCQQGYSSTQTSYPQRGPVEIQSGSQELVLKSTKIINNSTANYFEVICPGIGKKNTYDTLGFSGPTITIIDLNSSYNAQCRVVTTQDNGDRLFEGDWLSTSGDKSTPQTLSLAPLGTPGRAASANGNVFIRCNLPNNTSIVSYELGGF